MINVVEVKSKKQKRQFVDFPTRLYNGNENYVHPLRGDEFNIFNPKKNVSYNECEIVFYLAYKDGQVAGRICGILQKVYNEKTSRKCVRFSRFDCIEDFEVAKALLTKVEEWAKMQGMDTVHGPLGFHDLEREGLLIEGFDRLATFEENYNYPYYAEYIEKCGYKKLIKGEFMKKELPEFAYNDEKNLVNSFSRFTTYFADYNKNRENMYTGKDYLRRLLSVSLTRICQNF